MAENLTCGLRLFSRKSKKSLPGSSKCSSKTKKGKQGSDRAPSPIPSPPYYANTSFNDQTQLHYGNEMLVGSSDSQTDAEIRERQRRTEPIYDYPTERYCVCTNRQGIYEVGPLCDPDHKCNAKEHQDVEKSDLGSDVSIDECYDREERLKTFYDQMYRAGEEQIARNTAFVHDKSSPYEVNEIDGIEANYDEIICQGNANNYVTMTTAPRDFTYMNIEKADIRNALDRFDPNRLERSRETCV